MAAPWLPVPHRKQRHRADCLAACAAMALDYLGITVSYPSLLQLLDITPDLGAPASNIRRLSALGISVTYSSGTLHALTEHLAQRRPCIAFVYTTHLSYWSEATRHAVVIVGMNERLVYLNDPFFDIAPQVVARLEFALAWDEMDNIYAVLD